MKNPAKPLGFIQATNNIEGDFLKQRVDELMSNIDDKGYYVQDNNILRDLTDLKDLLNSLSPEPLELSVAHMYKNGYIRPLILMLKRELYSEENEPIVEEIVKMFVSILSIADLDILNKIAKDGLIVIFERLLDTKNVKMLESVIIGLSNLVSSNPDFKTHFKDIELTSKIAGVLRFWIIHDQVTDNLLSSYSKFINQYFTTKPLLEYSEVKNYVEFFFKLYVTFHISILSSCEEEILEFLSSTLLLASGDEMDELAGMEKWDKLLEMMIDNLVDKNNLISEYSAKILSNLTYSDSGEIFVSLLKTPVFDNCIKTLKTGNDGLRKDILIFLSNIFVFGGDFVSDICKNNYLLHVIVEQINNNETFENLKAEYLSVFKNLFAFSDNKILAEYLYQNYDLIQIFIEKLSSKETSLHLTLYYNILKELFEIGNFIKIHIPCDYNVFVEYVFNDEFLIAKLEEVQHHPEIKIADMFADLILTYFKPDS